ncbi:MAG TPA: ATP-binding cassette domain-containing protein, partial [Burkholderiales bacterium]|nr:ATP-binding cassette domain-containing protein [Burkholderiales bacterium]
MEIEVDIRRRLHTRGRSFTLEARFSSSDDFVVLFGHSGSGKTLTLRALAGLDRPDEGLIRVGGK